LNPPPATGDIGLVEPHAAKILRLKELLYSLGRCSVFCDDRAVDKLPPWTVYQSLVEEDVLSTKSNIIFNPIIMAAPNDYNTVYTTLKRVKEQ